MARKEDSDEFVVKTASPRAHEAMVEIFAGGIVLVGCAPPK